MSAKKVDEAIAAYYKSKGEFEASYARRKKKILRERIPIAEKRAKVARLQRRCVGCKGLSGVHFSTEGTLLKASCGQEETGCPLDIQVDRGRYELAPELLEKLSAKLEQQKTEIIRLKLDLLFGLKHEAAALAEFEQLKGQYKETLASVAKVDKFIRGLKTVTVRDIGGERTLSIRELDVLQRQELARLVRDVRVLMRNYEKEDNSAQKRAYLGDAVEVYTGQILPTVAKARSEDYAVSTVTEDHGVYRLVQMRKTMADEEVTLSPGKVISNKK
jgi:hypothetical protein